MYTLNLSHHEYLWMQTLHERPIAYGIQQSWLHRSELWRRLDEVSRKASSWRNIRQQCKLNACQSSQRLLNELNKVIFNTLYCTLILFLRPSTTHSLLLWTDIFGTPIVKVKCMLYTKSHQSNKFKRATAESSLGETVKHK